MAFRALKRGSLLIPSGPSHDPGRMHLFVICTNPCDEGNQVIVPIDSWINSLCDPTCIVNAYEHRFIRKKSFVLYRKARIENQLTLLDGIDQGYFTPHDDFNGQTFLKIKNGLCKSNQTPRKVKLYLDCDILVES
jgi:hypothetical protein